MVSESRERMVRSAASLIATRGACATSFADVISESGAPRGSIYHHFPDGKTELVGEAVRWTSDQILAHLRAGTGRTPQQVMRWFVELWRRSVLASRGSSGCAVAAVALDSDARAPDLIDAARVSFRSWSDEFARQLVASGLTPARARSVAVTTVAAMEGALILCRAEGDIGPLETVARELKRLLPPTTA